MLTSGSAQVNIQVFARERRIFQMAYEAPEVTLKKASPKAGTSGTDPAEGSTQPAGFDLSLCIPIEEMHPWTPDIPYLYTLKIQFGSDLVESYFAMRTFTVEPDRKGIMRFHLNHKPYFLHGVLDQGYWPDGLYTAPSDKALIFDIRSMQRLGFNMMRKHIKIESARW